MPCCTQTTTACSDGHLECLQALHQSGAPWNELTVVHAAFTSELECLEYCLEQGCPMDPYILYKLLSITDIEEDIVRCLVLHGAIVNQEGTRFCNEIAGTGNLPFLIFLEEHGAIFSDETLTVAAFCGHMHIVEYLEARGFSLYLLTDELSQLVFEEPDRFKTLVQKYHLTLHEKLLQGFIDSPNNETIDISDPFWKRIFYNETMKYAPKFQAKVRKQYIQEFLVQGSFLHEDSYIPKELVKYILPLYL